MSPPRGRKPRAARPTALEAPRTVAECLADLGAPACTCAAIRENYDPEPPAPGAHHCDCPQHTPDPIPGAGLPPAPRSGESTGRGALLCGWCHNRPDASHATCAARPEAFRCECACRRGAVVVPACVNIPTATYAAAVKAEADAAEATTRIDLLAFLEVD